MDNNNYSSLTDKLIQNGILSSSKNDAQNIFEKFYDIEPDEDYSNSPFHQKPEESVIQNKKRINEYDLELLKKEGSLNNLSNKKTLADKLLFRFFPKIYRARIIKKTMKKFVELNIDTKNLFSKTIPYGENEIHYNELVKYLKCATELQTELSDNN